MNLKRKEASCYEHESLSELKALDELNKGTFTNDHTPKISVDQLFTCQRCGLLRSSIGRAIRIFCVEGRVVTLNLCLPCAREGAQS